jgi:hypothetical protein
MPLIVWGIELPLLKETVRNVTGGPAVEAESSVAAIAVKATVEVPAVNVRPVVVAKLSPVLKVSVKVELPRFIARVLLLLDVRDCALTA